MAENEAGMKRAAEESAEGDEQPDAKQVKADLNPLTGAPYTRRFYELLERRQRLPAWGARDEFLRLIAQGQVVILVGAPGSGKTTQMPQILLDAGYHVQNGQIKALACAQPNDVAATLAAQRIAEELEVPLGSFVGYQVKFDDKTSNDTLLRMVSAQSLLREVLVDPQLQRYSVVLVDEAHLRATDTDVLLGLVKGALGARPELKLVVMSASLESTRFQSYFDGAPLLHMPCMSHAVELLYMTNQRRNYVKAAIQAVLQIHQSEPPGDILLFLASEEDVEHVCAQVRRESLRQLEHGELIAVPLHAGLPPPQLQKCFEPAPTAKVQGGKPGRKVVVISGVAETSVAVDNIVYVIDTGFEQQRFYNPRIRMQSTFAAPVTLEVAKRRASAASRCSPGKCFRIYAEKSAKDAMSEISYPEVMRSDLTALVLILKRLGIENLTTFDFLDPPPPEALMRAIETLNYLGCLDDDGDMTDIGDKICKFPVEPMIGKMLVEAPRHRCSNEALSIAAMLAVVPVFVRPSGQERAADEARSRFAHVDGDHLTLLNVFHAYKQHVQDGVDPLKFCGENFINPRALHLADRIREQLRMVMDLLGLAMVSTDFSDKEYYLNIRRCLLSGFFTQVSFLDKPKLGIYLTAKECEEVSLHPFTCLQHKPEWVVYGELVQTSRNFMRTVTPVAAEWLAEASPTFFDAPRLRKEAKAALDKSLSRRK